VAGKVAVGLWGLKEHLEQYFGSNVIVVVVVVVVVVYLTNPSNHLYRYTAVCDDLE